MKILPFWFSLILSLGATAAHADQASYLQRQEAFDAGNQIKLGQEVRLFCQPCGDTRSESMMVFAIGVYYTGYEEFFALELNGLPVDLAYTYIPFQGEWYNLALLQGIEVVQVPKILPADLPNFESSDLIN